MIAFIDLATQQQAIRGRLDAAIARVLEHGKYIMGPEIAELEQQLAEYCGVKHAVTCGSGTDALLLALMAVDVGPGDAVFVPSFTFVATAEVVALVGATPVFVDCDPDTYLIDCEQLSLAIADSPAQPRAIIPVDLFGQPADYDSLVSIAAEHDLVLIADAAQSFGATMDNRRVGTLAPISVTSFFPAKPLGCYGDGGAVFTDDSDLADICRSLRIHGKGPDKYDNVRIGINGRMDTLQAAILIEKLAIFNTELAARQVVAEHYSAAFTDTPLTPPKLMPGRTSVWAQYTLKHSARDTIVARLRDDSIPTAIYYPTPLHQQSAYVHHPCAPGGAPQAESLSRQVFSLPMHPYLETSDQNHIIECVVRATD